MIYRVVRVKLNSRNRLPKAPHASEVALRAVHLVFVNMHFFKFYWAFLHCPHHWGSRKPICIGILSWSNWPLSILFLQGETRAMMDMAFATGPVVAAIKGIAVDANHQTWGSSSSAGLMWNWLWNQSPIRCLLLFLEDLWDWTAQFWFMFIPWF